MTRIMVCLNSYPLEELTNHGQSNPEQTVEPDPRQALHAAPVEQTTNRGRRIPIYSSDGNSNK